MEVSMTRRSSLLAACGIGVAVLGWASSGSAQALQVLPGSVATETIRRALTSPGAWLLNWPDTTLGNLTGNAILTFEARGAELVVRIENRVFGRTCEQPAVVSSQGVAFDGCLEKGIVLRATPDDPAFAFRGASPQRWYTLTPLQAP